MKYIVCSVYDVKTEVFQRPFVAIAEGEAIRSFCDICKDQEHALGQHPEDYSLFKIGSFNDSSGELIDCVSLTLITGLEARNEGEG